MAENVAVGGEGTLFVGEDKIISLELKSKTSETTAINMTGWSMIFDIRKTDAATTALLIKTPTLTGTFNALRSSNTQRAQVVFTDDDTNLFRANTYRYSWKRLDPDSETILMWGDFVLEKATAV